MEEMYDNKQRTSFYQKNDNLEHALLDLNNLIDPIKSDKLQKQPSIPIVLFMGCPRSGSTLIFQWLTSLGIFSYPSNLIARFYKNPYIGIRVQQTLVEYDPINQLGINQAKPNFSSSLGKTIGALSPSEFWYFWREFFIFKDSCVLTEEELLNVNYKSFLFKLSAFERLTGKPLAMKGMLLNWHIPYLYKINKKFIFVDLNRDSFYNAQSLLFAREKFFGTRLKWYSLKPEEYRLLLDKEPIEQVAGQVVFMRKAINKGMDKIPISNKISINYNEFCSNPSLLLDLLSDKFLFWGYNLDTDRVDKSLFKPFNSRDKILLNQKEANRLNDYINRYSEV